MIPKVYYPENNQDEFCIFFDLVVKNEEDFELSLTARGDFKTSQKITPDIKISFINTNAPAILYPYLRAFVSTLTTNMGSGFKPILLPVLFFNGKLEEIN